MAYSFLRAAGPFDSLPAWGPSGTIGKNKSSQMEKRPSLREIRLKQERSIEATYREMGLDHLAGQFVRRHRVVKHIKPRYQPKNA
jgi:hypothetical protein